jgi:hypothetical protein
LKLFQEWVERGERRMVEEVNSTMIYCKNFLNITKYPQYNNNVIIFKSENIFPGLRCSPA